jgi:5-methyltetrahydropteroyltriglutamate--homocysteine methyltransferase
MVNKKILTTHVGSLIRPPELLPFIRAKQSNEAYDAGAYAKCLRDSVAAVVKRQVKAGVDIPSDGEFGKGISWSQYVLERMSGFIRRAAKPGEHGFARGADRARFADFYKELDAADGPPAAVNASAGVAV